MPDTQKMVLMPIDLLGSLCDAAEHAAQDYESLAEDGDGTEHKSYRSAADAAWEAVEAGRRLYDAPDARTVLAGLLRELQDFVRRWSKYPKPPTGAELQVYLRNAQAAIDKATATQSLHGRHASTKPAVSAEATQSLHGRHVPSSPSTPRRDYAPSEAQEIDAAYRHSMGEAGLDVA